MWMAGFLVNCSFAAVQLQHKQSQSLRLDLYVPHREGSIVVLPAANLRGPPDKYGPCLGFAVLKENLSLLEGLEFIPATSATTKGDIYVPGTYAKIFLFIFRLMRYTDV